MRAFQLVEKHGQAIRREQVFGLEIRRETGKRGKGKADCLAGLPNSRHPELDGGLSISTLLAF